MKSGQRTADVEALTHRYGREIFARLHRAGMVPFGPSWWDERLMEWSMGDESVKIQLFRFVDVLPLLHSPETIARHLREYFGEARENLPGWLTFGLRWLPSRGLLGGLLAKSAYRSAERLARKFRAHLLVQRLEDRWNPSPIPVTTFTDSGAGSLRAAIITADTNADMYLALSRAIGKIEKQALKLKKKIIDRKHTSMKTSVAAPNPDGDLTAAPAPVRIINASRYSVKPMTAEEAALNLSSKADHFIVFRDADTSRVGVLYKRQDGNFGLIEP